MNRDSVRERFESRFPVPTLIKWDTELNCYIALETSQNATYQSVVYNASFDGFKQGDESKELNWHEESESRVFWQQQAASMQEEIKGLNLDLGLSQVAVRQGKELLDSCEKALSDRDGKIEQLQAEVEALKELVVAIHHLASKDFIDSVESDLLLDMCEKVIEPPKTKE